MMNTGDRFFATVATAIIWGGAALIVLSLADNVASSNGGNLIWVMLFAMIAAAASTSAVWRGAYKERTDMEKAKSSRIQKLMRRLSESEIAELRARLSEANGDGEMSLDELLQQGERNR
jgi:hypothetical protein